MKIFGQNDAALPVGWSGLLGTENLPVSAGRGAEAPQRQSGDKSHALHTIGKNLGRGFEGDANPIPDGPPSQFAASAPFATSGLFSLPPVVLTAISNASGTRSPTAEVYTFKTDPESPASAMEHCHCCSFPHWRNPYPTR
jgi:hypothetical protein